MGPTSDDLKHDIEVKREELGAHVAELGEHVTPGRVAKRRWQSVRSSVLGTAESDDQTLTDTADSGAPPGRAIAAASFIGGLVLGIWLTRRRYLAKLANLDA
jgi:hypothetical protein